MEKFELAWILDFAIRKNLMASSFEEVYEEWCHEVDMAYDAC